METQTRRYSYCGSVGGVSQEGRLTSLDTKETSATEQETWLTPVENHIETSATEKAEWIAKKLEAIHSCGSKVILTIRDGCLKRVAVPIRCKSPVCPTCARLEQEETLRRYKPILEEAKRSSMYALFITLTTWQRPRNGEELRMVLKDLTRSYRKLLDMRLGPRKRKQLRDLFFSALSMSDIENKDLQLYLFDLFMEYCERNRIQKFRDLIKVGVRRPEITYSEDDGWFNPHFHVIWFTDCPIPQVLLSVLWTMVSGSPVVYIEEAYDRFDRELIKYMTKWWDIPEDLYGEVLWGLKGMKKVMVHGVKLLKEPKKCPHCNREDCEAHPVAIAELKRSIDHRYRHGDKWEGEVIAIRKLLFVNRWCLVLSDPRIEVIYREDEGFVWNGDWISFDLSIPMKNSIWFSFETFSQLYFDDRSPPKESDLVYEISEEDLDF